MVGRVACITSIASIACFAYGTLLASDNQSMKKPELSSSLSISDKTDRSTANQKINKIVNWQRIIIILNPTNGKALACFASQF
jgi:hypothetical protein